MGKKVNSNKLSKSMQNVLFLLAIASTLWTNHLFAAQSKEWNLSIMPSFWAVNINGDIEVGVDEEGIENQVLHLSEKFSDLWKHIHNGGMLDVTLSKGNFGLFVNAMQANIKNIDVTTSGEFEVLVNSKFALYSAGIYHLPYQYDFSHFSAIKLGPYVGARYTKNSSSAYLIEAPEYNSSRKTHWTEPFIGAMLLFEINESLSLNLGADLGILKKTQDSYNMLGLIGYKPNNHVAVYLGYRSLYQSFTEGTGPDFFEWKMHMCGPIAGVALIF